MCNNNLGRKSKSGLSCDVVSTVRRVPPMLPMARIQNISPDIQFKMRNHLSFFCTSDFHQCVLPYTSIYSPVLLYNSLKFQVQANICFLLYISFNFPICFYLGLYILLWTFFLNSFPCILIYFVILLLCTIFLYTHIKIIILLRFYYIYLIKSM